MRSILIIFSVLVGFTSFTNMASAIPSNEYKSSAEDQEKSSPGLVLAQLMLKKLNNNKNSATSRAYQQSKLLVKKQKLSENKYIENSNANNKKTKQL